jgi:Ca2+-binding EF-hand superfamily protein
MELDSQATTSREDGVRVMAMANGVAAYLQEVQEEAGGADAAKVRMGRRLSALAEDAGDPAADADSVLAFGIKLQEKIERIFTSTDTNGDGTVSKHELVARLCGADDEAIELRKMTGLPEHISELDGSQDKLESFFESTDKNQDKVIDLEEFVDCFLGTDPEGQTEEGQEPKLAEVQEKPATHEQEQTKAKARKNEASARIISTPFGPGRAVDNNLSGITIVELDNGATAYLHADQAEKHAAISLQQETTRPRQPSGKSKVLKGRGRLSKVEPTWVKTASSRLPAAPTMPPPLFSGANTAAATLPSHTCAPHPPGPVGQRGASSRPVPRLGGGLGGRKRPKKVVLEPWQGEVGGYATAAAYSEFGAKDHTCSGTKSTRPQWKPQRPRVGQAGGAKSRRGAYGTSSQRSRGGCGRHSKQKRTLPKCSTALLNPILNANTHSEPATAIRFMAECRELGDVSGMVVVPISGAALHSAIGITAREKTNGERLRRKLWRTALVRCREALHLIRPVKRVVDPSTGARITSVEQLRRLDRVLVSCYADKDTEKEQQLSPVKSRAKEGSRAFTDVLFLPLIDCAEALPPIVS